MKVTLELDVRREDGKNLTEEDREILPDLISDEFAGLNFEDDDTVFIIESVQVQDSDYVLRPFGS